MKALFAASITVALLAGCSAAPQSFEIDNPTASAVQIEIDGNAQVIPARTSTTLTLASGAHTLHSDSLGDVNFLVAAGQHGGLINPTGSTYVIAASTDARHAPALSRFDGVTNGATVDGTVYEGPYRTSNALVIERSWRAGVHDAVPTARAVASSQQDAKIFAAADFVDFHRDVVEGPSTFAYVVNPGVPAPTYMAAIGDTAVPGVPSVFGEQADELRGLYTAYIGTVAPAAALNDNGTRLVYLQPAAPQRAVMNR